MKRNGKIWCRIVFAILTVLAVDGLPVVGEPLTFYVSCNGGDDGNPGERRMPFRTIYRALKMVRVLGKVGAVPPDGIVVDVAPGCYELPAGIELEDIRGHDGRRVLTFDGHGKAVLAGSVTLRRTAFRPVSAPEVLKRLNPAAIGHVSCCDLKAVLGGTILAGGAIPDVFQGMFPFGELMLDGNRLPLARWPNAGWAAFDDLVSDGRQDGSGEAVLKLGAAVPLERWQGADGLWLQGFWCHDWYEETIRVASVDGAAMQVRLRSKNSRYGIGSRSVVNRLPRRFRVLNALSELDSEGEWCLEPGTGLLYAWLPKYQEDERLAFTTLRNPLMTLRGCGGVTVRGFTFCESRGDGILAEGNGVEVVDCEFKGLGGTGVVLKGRHHALRRCDIQDCGGAGASIRGGDVRSLEPGACVVEDCHIWNIGCWNLTYQGAVHLSGVGNVVRHNLIHDVPHTGIFYGGNEHCIEWNDIFGVCLETGDGGALYSGRSWGSFGNRVRHNFVHDTGGYGVAAKGVYLDDFDSGDSIEGNVFADVPDAVFIGGGRHNSVVQNVFIGCFPAICLEEREKSAIHWGAGIQDSWDLLASLEAVNYRQPPWSTAYPQLAKILQDSPTRPLHNSATGNIAVNSVLADMPYLLRKDFEERGNWKATSMDEVPFADWKADDYALTDMAAVRRVIPDFKKYEFQAMGTARVPASERRKLYDACRRRLAEPPLAVEEKRGNPPGILDNVMIAGTLTRTIDVDGKLGYDEWRDSDYCGKALVEMDATGARTCYPSLLLVLAGDGGLYVGVIVDAAGQTPLRTTGGWGVADGVEITLGEKAFRGYPDGSCTKSAGVSFAAESDGQNAWASEWFIPWKAVGGRPNGGGAIPFNVAIYRSSRREMQYWRLTDERNKPPRLMIPARGR